MKNQWRIILGLVLTMMIVIFAILNNLSVPVSFGFAKFSAPLIVIIIGSAFIGAVIIALVATGTMWQQRREIKQLHKEIADFKATIDSKVVHKEEELEREYNNKVAELEAKYATYPDEPSTIDETSRLDETPEEHSEQHF